MWVANRSMTNLYRVLAVDTYLNSMSRVDALEIAITREKTNACRAFVRYLDCCDDEDVNKLVASCLRDHFEDSELSFVAEYVHDDQWYILLIKNGETLDTEVDIDVIYDIAYHFCNF